MHHCGIGTHIHNHVNQPNTKDLKGLIMDEMLLVKCTNYIWVHEVTSILQANNIVFRQHDETTDQRNGAYGPIIGISIYVFVKDYEKAKAVTVPILNDMDHSIVCCLKCGSEYIGLHKQYKKRAKLVNSIVLLSTLFIMIAVI